jgi:integrase
MMESAAKSSDVEAVGGRSCAVADGCLVPAKSLNCVSVIDTSGVVNGHMVPTRPRPVRRAFLDGNFARRKQPDWPTDYIIWDTELAGFGLRVRPSGKHVWFVRLRQRGRHRRIGLGRCEDVDAVVARKMAQRLLAEAALDGLPKRVAAKAAPLFCDFVDDVWQDFLPHWKPATIRCNARILRTDLLPAFGAMRLDVLTRADIVRWRDSCATVREGTYNRGVPVMSALMVYAEQLGYRVKGSNPCRGLPRFKREPVERYLTPEEYRRVGAALRADAARHPVEVAAVRLLLYTGARYSEILGLKWDWVQPPRLALPDSKTGPKTVYLNAQAEAVLNGITRHENCPWVFPNRKRTGALTLTNWWPSFRRQCRIPDVRIHDLRHSFASLAITHHVPLATIGKLLSHELPETTAKYAHLADDSIAEAAQRICGSLALAMGHRPLGLRP